MKRHMHKIFGGGLVKKRSVRLMTGLGLVAVAVWGVWGATGVYADLEYETNFGLSFTVNESMTVTVPSSGLTIDELAPGTMADSEIITVNVQSNSGNGYVLNATVGNGTYTDRDLWHEDYAAATPVTNVFSSIDYAATPTVTALETPNTWGYSYSTDGGTNWANYNGLPLYTDTEHVATLASKRAISGAAGDNIEFKIAAYAGVGQALGEYNNVINFEAVANATPVYYMQDVASWGSTITSGMVVQAADTRDGKSYYVARLTDGNLWMTQNLDLDLGATYLTNGDAVLRYGDTDLGRGGTVNTAASWNTSSYATRTTATWSGSAATPESYDPGDACWDTVVIPTQGEVTTGTTLSAGTAFCNQNASHYHMGNYYNWTAAVAMGSSSGYTSENDDADQSICPAGWTLPKSGTSQTGSGSFSHMLTETGLDVGATGDIHASPAYFVYGGSWTGTSTGVGHDGLYWSSVAYDSDGAYSLSFDADGGLSGQENGGRSNGYSIRCVAR